MNKKNNQIRNNKGITLIALVITIIILIILAGVSISLVLDENGIVKKAKEAKENMQIAGEEEKELLGKIENFIDDTLKNEGENDEIIEDTTEYAPYNNPYIPEGFSHTEGTWNSGYIIRDGLENEFVWVPCVLDQTKVKPGDKVETFKKTLPTTTDTTDPYYKYNVSNLAITGEQGTSASEIEISVGTYGGFYIARYEAGIKGTTENGGLATKTATDGSVKPLSQEGKGVWNYISRTNAMIVSSSMVNTEDGVKSSLISSACWDTTLQWIVNSSENRLNEPNLGYDIDSTGNGWHSDVSNNTRHTTGYYAVNNIYDMAGNVWEWTTENCTTNGNRYVILRGGEYVYTGSFCPAAYRYSVSDLGNSTSTGFRVVLYKSV